MRPRLLVSSVSEEQRCTSIGFWVRNCELKEEMYLTHDRQYTRHAVNEHVALLSSIDDKSESPIDGLYVHVVQARSLPSQLARNLAIARLTKISSHAGTSRIQGWLLLRALR